MCDAVLCLYRTYDNVTQIHTAEKAHAVKPHCGPNRCMLAEWKSSMLNVNLTPSWRCLSCGEHARHAARQGEWENLQQRDRCVRRCDAVRGHRPTEVASLKEGQKKFKERRKGNYWWEEFIFFHFELLMLLFLSLVGHCRTTGCIIFIGLGLHS